MHSLPSPSRKCGANRVVQPEKRPVGSTGVVKNGNKIEDWSEVPRKRDAVGKLKQVVDPSGGLKLQKKAEDQVQASRRPIDVLVRLTFFFLYFLLTVSTYTLRLPPPPSVFLGNLG